MIHRICKTAFVTMFAMAAAGIRRQSVYLSELDSVAGDGDHGTSMLRVAEKMETAFDPASSQTLQTLLKNAGWSVLEVDGGASSAILGTFFGGMAGANIGDEISCAELADVFQSGLSAVSRQTKAQPGDKTMMDALVPAVCAIRSAASAGKDIASALEAAAVAARSGAELTKGSIAKYGRAKFLGEKTLGYPDPGAFSVALIFEGFSAAFASERVSGSRR